MGEHTRAVQLCLCKMYWVLNSHSSCKLVKYSRFCGKHFRSGNACDIRVVYLVPLLRSITFHVCDVVTWARTIHNTRMSCWSGSRCILCYTVC